MRYLKVGVPDDFNDEEIAKLNIVDYTKDKQDPARLKLWEPKYTNVLDYGYVGLVDFMGDDSTIVNAARVSYGKGTKKVQSDRGLIRYLMRHRHATPFEMVSFTFHVKAPIFVYRQWHRHRAASINEYSGRYSEMEDEMYLPEMDKAAPQSKTNRQGRDSEILSENDYKAMLAAMEQIFNDSFETYKYLLGPNEDGGMPKPPDAINTRKLWIEESSLKAARQMVDNLREKGEEIDELRYQEIIADKLDEYMAANEMSVFKDDYPGLARELSRIVLPLATYSQMYWKSNLRNLFHFIGLRSDPHAQYEIRSYSDAMLELIRPYVPWAVDAFIDYHLEGGHFSRMEVDVIKMMYDNLSQNGLGDEYWSSVLRSNGMSIREVDEFLSKMR